MMFDSETKIARYGSFKGKFGLRNTLAVGGNIALQSLSDPSIRIVWLTEK